MARLLYFRGEGKGFMSGVTEYVVLKSNSKESVENYQAPGFKLFKAYSVEINGDVEWPCELPIDETLAPRG
jgi:hypothetical protein